MLTKDNLIAAIDKNKYIDTIFQYNESNIIANII